MDTDETLQRLQNKFFQCAVHDINAHLGGSESTMSEATRIYKTCGATYCVEMHNKHYERAILRDWNWTAFDVSALLKSVSCLPQLNEKDHFELVAGALKTSYRLRSRQPIAVDPSSNVVSSSAKPRIRGHFNSTIRKIISRDPVCNIHAVGSQDEAMHRMALVMHSINLMGEGEGEDKEYHKLLRGMIAFYHATERALDDFRQLQSLVDSTSKKRKMQESVMVAELKGDSGQGFGEAIWPFIGASDSYAFMRSCKTIRQSGMNNSRKLRFLIELQSKAGSCELLGQTPNQDNQPNCYVARLKKGVMIQMRPSLAQRHLVYSPTPENVVMQTERFDEIAQHIDKQGSAITLSLLRYRGEQMDYCQEDSKLLRRARSPALDFYGQKLAPIKFTIDTLSSVYQPEAVFRIKMQLHIKQVAKAGTQFDTVIMETISEPFVVVARMNSVHANIAERKRREQRSKQGKVKSEKIRQLQMAPKELLADTQI
jgi:hypothetical protein